MSNGEGTRENVSEVASPDSLEDSMVLWRGQNPLITDGADADSSAPSQYSSCVGSDFDRYCSANSVIGTPSMCSTITVFNDCTDSELGTVRNVGFADDSGVENFSLGGNFERNQSGMEFLGDRKIELRKRSVVGEPSIRYGSSGLEMYDDGEFEMLNEVNHGGLDEMMSWKIENGPCLDSVPCVELNSSSDKGDEGFAGARGNDGLSSKEDVESKGMEGRKSEVVRTVDKCSSSCVVGAKGNMDFDGRENEREEDGTSSRFKHLEGEDSLYNYGNDDDHGTDTHFQRDFHYLEQAKDRNENPLHMNSSVAFGSDDWDDFELETGGHTQVSLTVEVFQNKRGKNPNSFSMAVPISQVTEQPLEGVDIREIPLASKEAVGDKPEVNVNSSKAEVRDIPVASCRVEDASNLTEVAKSSFVTEIRSPAVVGQKQEDAKDVPVSKSEVQDFDELGNVKSLTFDKIVRMDLDELSEKVPLEARSAIMDCVMEKAEECIKTEEVVGSGHSEVSKNEGLETSKLKLDPLSDVITSQLYTHSMESPENIKKLHKDHHREPFHCTSESKSEKVSSVSKNLTDNHLDTVELDNLEINELYDEVVLEMEEILLDSVDSPGAMFSQGNKMFQSHRSLPLRDGSSTASTSGNNDVFSHNQQTVRIDEVEVVGARQKMGDVSFSERLVGVKEYTVYKIRIWSGTDQWEVEHRYRDFYSLYCQLKTLFTDKGWTLPSPWSSVEKESRKIFGNASPDVITERSAIIQECVRSVLHYRFFSTSPNALIWFLSPQDSSPKSSSSNTVMPHSSASPRGPDTQNFFSLGKTISLIVEIRPYKSMKQMLESQHYSCAGCHRYFGDGKTLIQEFVQTFGWGKPRLCEYTGQLFCASCHANDTAVLPARVLHHWDFMRYPVSQMAKSYLDSIHDQPMLCISAVNPFLFSKVSSLLNVMGIRKKIGTILPYVRCPFRKSINRGLGSRRYLLDSNDFFALRDLIDLSKGAFAALPAMVDTISRKIMEHIAEQCLVCCDVGIPCGARKFCSDPSSLIFPFQEGEVEKCTSCQSAFHKPCFKKLTRCPCGQILRADETV